VPALGLDDDYWVAGSTIGAADQADVELWVGPPDRRSTCGTAGC
jgi:hypothetical protein